MTVDTGHHSISPDGVRLHRRQLVPVLAVVAVDGAGVVRVVGRVKVGHTAARQSQGPANCSMQHIVIRFSRSWSWLNTTWHD